MDCVYIKVLNDFQILDQRNPQFYNQKKLAQMMVHLWSSSPILQSFFLMEGSAKVVIGFSLLFLVLYSYRFLPTRAYLQIWKSNSNTFKQLGEALVNTDLINTALWMSDVGLSRSYKPRIAKW